MANRKVLVTGGAGFIGSHLIEALLEMDWFIRVLDPNCIGNPNLAHVANHVELIDNDFSNQYMATTALQGVDILLHFATTTTPVSANDHEYFDIKSNLLNTFNLFDLALKNGVSRIIFPSSGGTIYGITSQIPISEKHPCEPISSHAIVKRAIESYLQLLCRKYRANYTILRYANPYGPRQNPNNQQGAVAVFAGKIIKKQPIDVWGDGSAIRDFIYIDDLVNATVATICREHSLNQIFNIGSGVGASINEIISLIEKMVNTKAIVNYHPARSFDIPVNILNIEKAKNKLTWAPVVQLPDGLKKTIHWLYSFFNQ